MHVFQETKYPQVYLYSSSVPFVRILDQKLAIHPIKVFIAEDQSDLLRLVRLGFPEVVGLDFDGENSTIRSIREIKKANPQSVLFGFGMNTVGLPLLESGLNAYFHRPSSTPRDIVNAILQQIK